MLTRCGHRARQLFLFPSSKLYDTFTAHGLKKEKTKSVGSLLSVCVCIVGHNKHLIFLELECVVADTSPAPAPVDEVGSVEASVEDMCEKDLPFGSAMGCRRRRLVLLSYGRVGGRDRVEGGVLRIVTRSRWGGVDRTRANRIERSECSSKKY